MDGYVYTITYINDQNQQVSATVYSKRDDGEAALKILKQNAKDYKSLQTVVRSVNVTYDK